MVNAYETMDPEEVYEILADEIGLEDLNEQIVRAIPEDGLMSLLEYVARANCLDLEHYNEEEDEINYESDEEKR